MKNMNNVNNKKDIFRIATKNVVSVPITTSIIDTAKIMERYSFRRIPITDAGTNRLNGIVTTVDIVNLLGGGSKYNLIKNKYQGNLLATVNSEIKEIMEKNVICLMENDTIIDAAEMLIKKGIGGLPIIDKKKILKGIVTERDFIKILVGNSINTDNNHFREISYKKIKDYMSKKVIYVDANETFGLALRKMLDNGFRRLPVIKDNVLIGSLTATSVMRFLGSGKIFNKLVTGDFDEIYNLEVKNVMLNEFNTLDIDMNVIDAAKKMSTTNSGGFPVLNGDRMVGIFTERDLLRVIYDHARDYIYG
ncbi:MAG: CBS domain-containing protein [Candidatus Methanoliparum thermophilum]|uniref:CBS domain-containing protein n=1 Tax=Methanoliparum thermophilum TaxID=2491083 RepID=A0A520KQY6_METT2|nr:CBS domain-containing protein [Candidatus Methanoliparum sp. LAM-1]RZN64023.1 MAG: CBS domain-containing protein [Candidatus Methanoliparum thermophilum]